MAGKILLTALYLSLSVGTVAGTEDSEIQRARKTLESSARAYREVTALRDKLSYTVAAPGAEEETKVEEYVFGPHGSVLVKNALLQAVAVDSQFYLTQSDVPNRYVTAPYDGDFGAVLRRVAGKGSLFEPPALALHQGKGIDEFLATLRFNLLAPLAIAGFSESANGSVEIRFVASNGELRLIVDQKTHFFAGVSFEVKPPGAPDGMMVRVQGTFSPQVLSAPEAAINFDPGTRTAVESLADLASTRLAAGSTAPDFELETLDGKKVALHDLRGSTVVLDFWATWCVPCWTALKETQALSEWAATERLPVAVFAVNTLERGSDNNEKLERVRRFWKSQHFTMPSLIDPESKMFSAYQSPGLPSVVVVSPSGKVFRCHEGLFPQMFETLKGELRESLHNAR
jgi:peroxiredoxin